MGREIRKVPPNWVHPKRDHCPHWPRCEGPEDCLQPKYNEEFKKASQDWYDKAAKYKHGYMKSKKQYFHEYEGSPPDRDYYLDFDPHSKKNTWVQLYETVSEGCPVSPAFATREELADYLATNGDYWDQKRRAKDPSREDAQPWGKESAYKFVMGDGWAPSFVMTGGKIISGVQAVTEDKT